MTTRLEALSALSRPASARAPVGAKDIGNLSDLLDAIIEHAHSGPTQLREILATIGRRSYGPLLLFIGLFAISPATIVPGMTWFSAALTLVVALQMLVGMGRPWLPEAALRLEAPGEKLREGAESLRPWARRVDRVLKPRLKFLTKPPFVNLIALFCIAAALITFPLGFIPFAPLAPGAAIVFFGLGMTARDGLLLALGMAALALAFWLVWPLLS